MFNSASPSVKFLRDENVKIRLEKFLKQKGIDITSKPSGLSNGKLAEFSMLEERMLITNDKHFTDASKFPKEKIFGVIWLRIPQDNPQLLIDAFSDMLERLKDFKDFKGKIITLYLDKFDISPIQYGQKLE